MAFLSSCLDLPNTLIDSKLKEYREVFSFFDRDGGGTITTVELGQVMRTFGWNPSEGDLLVGKLYSTYVSDIKHIFKACQILPNKLGLNYRTPALYGSTKPVMPEPGGGARRATCPPIFC